MLHCSIFNVHFSLAFRSKQKILYYAAFDLSTKTFTFFKIFYWADLAGFHPAQYHFLGVGETYDNTKGKSLSTAILAVFKDFSLFILML